MISSTVSVSSTVMALISSLLVGGLSFSSRVMTLIALAGVLRYIGLITIGDDVDGVANDALDGMGGEMIFGGG